LLGEQPLSSSQSLALCRSAYGFSGVAGLVSYSACSSGSRSPSPRTPSLPRRALRKLNTASRFPSPSQLVRRAASFDSQELYNFS
jgi:hypothetical protein